VLVASYTVDPDKGEPTQGWIAAESDCNCWHIQILSQQQPTNHRPATSIDSTHHDLVTPLAEPLTMVQPSGSQVEFSASPFEAASSFVLLERASVCLRC